MKEIIAFCGIVCSECPAYKATITNDDDLRRETAKKWTSDEFPIAAEHINCYGCTISGQKLMEFCSACKVRCCGLEKGVKNCAYCEEYACELLEGVWKYLGLPEIRQKLEQIRKSL